ncbi:MAG: hypothetical protein FWF33_00755, partial [Clostridiales bacterium]|nr:hypothetical protein [Clostridiales bacterium]
MGEIKYTYEKLSDSAATISSEREQMQTYDQKFLDDLKTDISMFHSGYADKIGDTISNMKDVGADDLIYQLDQYSTTLSTAESLMKE